MIPGSSSRPTAASKLCGIHEAAELLNVERATVDKWRRRGVMPTPDFDLRGGPVWWASTLEAWARQTGRFAGYADL